MKSIAEQILEGLDRFYKAFQRKRVLKSLEEVSATTNEEDVAAAVTVAELYNKLGEQPEWIKDATGKITGYRFGGADTVFPFNTNYRMNCRIKVGGPGFDKFQSGYIDIIDGKVSAHLPSASVLYEVTAAGIQGYHANLYIDSIVEI